MAVDRRWRELRHGRGTRAGLGAGHVIARSTCWFAGFAARTAPQDTATKQEEEAEYLQVRDCSNKTDMFS